MPSGDVQSAIVARLRSDDDLGALIGDRIYPHLFPQTVSLPAISYGTTIEPVNANDGSTGTTNATLTLTIYASDYQTVRRVGDLTKASLDGWTSTGTPAISPVLLITDRDGFDKVDDGTDRVIPWREQEFSIWYAA